MWLEKNQMKITPLFFALGLAIVCPPVQSAPVKSSPAKTPAAKTPRRNPNVWTAATQAQRVAAAASIRAQLEAFKRNDWTKAATYQSEGLRRNFGTIAQFRAVIETNYPQFAKYGSIAFDEARALGDRVQMQVRLTGQDGVKLRAVYLMKKEQGIYRVEGVQGGSLGGDAPRGDLPPGVAV